MTKTSNVTTRVLRSLLSLAVVLAIYVSCISAFGTRSFAEEAKTFEQTLAVKQTVEGNANRTKYTYRLTPKKDGCPLPEGAKDGVYEFVLDGNDLAKLLLAFPADVAANYQYELTRPEATPKGDTVDPETHLFGYLVEKDADGNWVIIPYTCYDGHMEIWKATDADGNPLGITLTNEIVGTKGDKGDPGEKGDKGDQGDKGDKGDKGDPGTDGKDGKDGSDGTNGKDGSNGTDGRDGTDGKNGTNGTNGRDGKDGVTTIKTITQTVTKTVAKAVNTGDPNHILLWGGMILASAGALTIIAIVRRKKEKDEKNS